MEFNSIADFKRNFAHIYHKDVVPQLRNMEVERQKVFKKAMTISGIVAAVGVAIAVFMVLATSEIDGLIVIGALFFSIAWGTYSYRTKNFETNLKIRLMPVLMPAFGTFNWTQAGTVSESEIVDSKLFRRTDNIRYDDNFYGTYRGMPINIAETYIYYVTRDSKGHRHTHTVFDGALVTIEVGKNFTGHTIVRKRGMLLNTKDYEEVKLEDPEFTKQFFVDSNDQIESRYILTTAFMERFKRISTAFKAEKTECSFRDNRLMLALSTRKDLFKLGDLNKPLTDTAPFQEFLNEIIAILEMIDHLKVTEKTGL